jgi:AcrR family transcriptional regulator
MTRPAHRDRKPEAISPRALPRAIGRPRGDTARRILAVAKDLIARDGLDALRLADVSTALGISPPALYAHFPGGRAEMIDHIARDGVQAMQGFFPRATAWAVGDLLEGVSAVVRFFADNRAFLRIMLVDFSSPEGHPSITAQIGAARGNAANGAFLAMFGRLDDLIDGCRRQGGTHRVSADVLLNVVIGATTLNLLYPPKGLSADTVPAVDAIVRDLVARYLGIPDGLQEPT